jgi:glucose-6-phosphate 1-dehydrogenase
MAGDATLFAREDYVEEAWRIVDPVLKQGTPVYPYEPKSWGGRTRLNALPRQEAHLYRLQPLYISSKIQTTSLFSRVV